MVIMAVVQNIGTKGIAPFIYFQHLNHHFTHTPDTCFLSLGCILWDKAICIFGLFFHHGLTIINWQVSVSTHVSTRMFLCNAVKAVSFEVCFYQTIFHRYFTKLIVCFVKLHPY
jgi:hypothetical protein